MEVGRSSRLGCYGERGAYNGGLRAEDGDFLNTDISQGSVATQLRCRGIFKYEFVANLPLSLGVKEF